MIYTSYFAKIKDLPPNVIPISICDKAPDWYSGRQYKKLAPKVDLFKEYLFNEWKQNHDNDFYVNGFTEQVLNQLNVFTVYDELYDLAETSGLQQYDICLLCYEKPGDFCHRHLVADWFNKNLIACEEWK